ncbi:MAG: hypothetical protein DRP93_02050 [Candidatus Neomarinimicrobiota bacterium]|nr:MAG: hypothetical protein DRP93_02050 [Candidatus Neomarinimicrobiota bacterium]
MGRQNYKSIIQKSFMSIALFFPLLNAQILLNEFMIDPDNDNTGEFVEIYNAGDSLVNMSAFLFCDAQDTDAVIPYPDSLLLPGHYGLILDPDYSHEYDYLIPDSITCFSINDSRFGMYGISNSTQKPFALLFPDHQISDIYLTGNQIWPKAGYSIERIRSQDSLWGSSLNISGTPGFRNSISPKDHEIKIRSLNCTISDDDLCVSFVLLNIGLQEINKCDYGYIVDISKEHPELNDTLIFHRTLPIFPGDSVMVKSFYHYRSKGRVSIYAFVSREGVQCDTLAIDADIPLNENELIINEFVCKTGDNFSSEYVEFLSRSTFPVQLNGLQIADMTGHIELEINHVISPDSLFVLAQSTSFYDDFPNICNLIIPPAWRSLNNSEDIIRLQNHSGSIICDLHYDADWLIPPDCAMQLVDSALNYHDPINWEASYSGSPGKYNNSQKQLLHLSCFSPMIFFTPLDLLSFFIINDGYFSLSEQELTLTTPVGEHTYFIPSSEPGDTIYLLPDTLNIFQPGTQICSLSCESYFSFGFKYYVPFNKPPCYFNEILFEPIDTYGQVEFIELECLPNELDLDHWQLKINNTVLCLNDVLKNPYNIFYDSDDPLSTFASSNTYAYPNFPSLPNSGADCYLLDPTGNIIDHCDLRDHPELHAGKSLEKQFSSVASDDRNIWFSSVSPWGMTPGRLNSITALPGSVNDLDIYPEIFSPGIDERIQFSIDSEFAISYCELLCFNLAGQLIYTKEQAVFSQPSCLLFWNGIMNNGDVPSRGLYLAIAIIHKIDGSSFQLRETFAVK